jgi:hypothetical protein
MKAMKVSAKVFADQIEGEDDGAPAVGGTTQSDTPSLSGNVTAMEGVESGDAVDDISVDGCAPLCIICRKNTNGPDPEIFEDEMLGEGVSIEQRSRSQKEAQRLGYLCLVSSEAVFSINNVELHVDSDQDKEFSETLHPCSVTLCGHAMHHGCFTQFCAAERRVKPNNRYFYHGMCPQHLLDTLSIVLWLMLLPEQMTQGSLFALFASGWATVGSPTLRVTSSTSTLAHLNVHPLSRGRSTHIAMMTGSQNLCEDLKVTFSRAFSMLQVDNFSIFCQTKLNFQ